MNPFRYARPESLAEVTALLAGHGPEARLLAGGTDLLVRIRRGRYTPRLVIDLKRVRELRAGIVEKDSALRIGALAVLADLIEDERVRTHFPALVEAAGTVGSVQIRNRATLAGNICNASPAADTAPALLVYGAAANIAGPRGARRVPVRDFFRGPGQTVLERGELVESIDLPLPQEKTGAAFARLTRRRGVDLATASACCLVNASGETFLAFGAVAARPLLVEDHTCLLADPQAGEREKEAVLKELIGRASPITDLRATRNYRRAMLLVMSRRALQAALARLAQAEGVI